MSRHSYKWDIIHVQGGGQRLAATRSRPRGGEHGSIASGRGRYYTTSYLRYSLKTKTVRGDTGLRVDHGLGVGDGTEMGF